MNKDKELYKQIDREIDKSILKFNECLMSNAKWIKLTNCLISISSIIQCIKFKKVQSNTIGELFIDENTTYELDYWDIGFEGCNSLGGWLTFKEIEYLSFPKRTNGIQQDLTAIKNSIHQIGKFIIEINEDELRLVCYR